jgi:uncharacterized protein (DUF58 family)
VSSSGLEELLALRGAARGLRLQARRPTHTPHSGSHRSSQRGRGLEFQEVRPYVSGDDPRTIDWRVTARRGKPHTKLFREERERPVWLLADLNGSMFFGTRRQLKSTVAVRAAALLAWSAALGGDRVGAVVAGTTSYKIVPPRAREAGVLPVLAALLDMQPNAPAQPADGLHIALQALAPLVHPGSLVLALSDYASLDARAAGPQWAALAVHNEFRLFWVTDPLERQALPDGRFRIGLPGRSLSIDGASVRSAWIEKWRQREARIQHLARGLNATVTQLDTSDPVESVLRPLLSGRRTAA